MKYEHSYACKILYSNSASGKILYHTNECQYSKSRANTEIYFILSSEMNAYQTLVK